MDTKLTAEEVRLDKVRELLKGTSLEDLDVSGDTAEEIIEYLRERINEEEVIYYSNAMKYLSEHDNSLEGGLELAEELGYSISQINSELLATLLTQEEMRLDLGGLIKEIETIFKD